MKHITFAGSGMLAALAAMLELMGHDATDESIALGMNAPYLFLRTEDGYKAGSALYRPQWLNLYLHPLGFHMKSEILPAKDVSAYLRANRPALLRVRIKPNIVHPIVFSKYEGNRYHFINVKALHSSEPDDFSFTAASLKGRLEEQATVYTLGICSPEPSDFCPLLRDSLTTLDAYQADVLAARQRELTLSEFNEMRTPLFRALMQDLLPLIAMTNDVLLADALRKLNHYYRHVFTNRNQETVCLNERLPKTLILQCITWLKEDILDRLYELGEMEDDV